MSQINDCDCAMFVSQHCSVNIKASAQGSSWKFKTGLSRKQVKAPAINVNESRDNIFQILTESNHCNEDLLNWCVSENITNLWQLKNRSDFWFPISLCTFLKSLNCSHSRILSKCLCFQLDLSRTIAHNVPPTTPFAFSVDRGSIRQLKLIAVLTHNKAVSSQFNDFRKYTSFLEIKNNFGRTNGEKNCFDDFATSTIRGEHSTIYLITIDNYLTALFDVISWNQKLWIDSRFITRWFILPLQNLKIRRIALSIHEDNIRYSWVSCKTQAQQENIEVYFDWTVTWKRFACSSFSDQPRIWEAIQCCLTGKRWWVTTSSHQNGKHAQSKSKNTQCWLQKNRLDFWLNKRKKRFGFMKF